MTHLVVISIFHICKLYNGSLFWFKINRNEKKKTKAINMF